MGCREFWKSNKTRVLISTVFSLIGIVLTVINLAATATDPSARLSWANYQYSYDIQICYTFKSPFCDLKQFEIDTLSWSGQVGLIKSHRCVELYSKDGTKIPSINFEFCETIMTGGVSDSNDLPNAGRGVIAANTFAMLFATTALVILWLYVGGKATKLRVPRIILTIANFMSLMLYIVSVSTWFKLALDPLPSQTSTFRNTNSDGGQSTHTSLITDVQTGYAVAVNIFVIVCDFIAWAFSAWRIWLPNKAEPDTTKMPPSNASAGGYGNYASQSNLLSPNSQAAAVGMAANFYNAPSTPGGGAYGDGASSGYVDSSSYGQQSNNGYGYNNNKGAYGY